MPVCKAGVSEKPSANVIVPEMSKSSEEKEIDKFLDEADKKSVSDGIRQRNKEKKLKKAEQASLNQDQESGTSDLEGIIPEVSNPVTEISAGAWFWKNSFSSSIIR